MYTTLHSHQAYAGCIRHHYKDEEAGSDTLLYQSLGSCSCHLSLLGFLLPKHADPPSKRTSAMCSRDVLVASVSHHLRTARGLALLYAKRNFWRKLDVQHANPPHDSAESQSLANKHAPVLTACLPRKACIKDRSWGLI